jgi:hypothetical protein
MWGIADHDPRDLYGRGEHRDVILPMTMLRQPEGTLQDAEE